MNQRIGDSSRLDVEDLEFIKDRLKTITRQVTNCIEISRRYLSFLRRHADDTPRVSVNQLLTDLSHLVWVHPSRHNNEFNVRPVTPDIAARMNGDRRSAGRRQRANDLPAQLRNAVMPPELGADHHDLPGRDRHETLSTDSARW
jgi:hypothetical protein